MIDNKLIGDIKIEIWNIGGLVMKYTFALLLSLMRLIVEFNFLKTTIYILNRAKKVYTHHQTHIVLSSCIFLHTSNQLVCLYYILRVVFSSDIHPNARIGKNFMLQHHFVVVIGKNSIVGNNVKIYNGVTLGQRNERNPAMHTIGDNAIIYKRATIVG